MLSISATDAFRVLDVSEAATPDEIKNAYRIMALKCHPDRHHNRHNKEAATRYFLEVTDAYRTLVREGHVKNRNTPMAKSRPEPTPSRHHRQPVRRPTPMAHKNSSESSISLDSFVHMVASSTETLTTPASSKRNSLRSSLWKQGIRKPEAAFAQYRNSSAQPHLFGFEAPSRKGAKGPALYTAPPSFTAPQRQPQSTETIPKVSSPSNLKPRNLSASQNVLPPSPSPVSQNYLRPSINPTKPYSSGDRSPVSPQKESQSPSRDSASLSNHIPPYAIPLLSIGLGPAGEWTYSISLTLEELFIGKHFRFGITRSYLSNKSKNVVIEIDIPAGCRPGTKILCRNVGHEWQPGVYQDIAFVIEEVPHDRFVRLLDDLIMDVRLPWVDSLRRQGGKVPFMGIDGRNLVIQIDYPTDKNMKGRSVIKGAGMPIRERGQVVGRGNLIVQWEILPPKTKILHFLRCLWGGR